MSLNALNIKQQTTHLLEGFQSFENKFLMFFSKKNPINFTFNKKCTRPQHHATVVKLLEYNKKYKKTATE